MNRTQVILDLLNLQIVDYTYGYDVRLEDRRGNVLFWGDATSLWDFDLYDVSLDVVWNVMGYAYVRTTDGSLDPENARVWATKLDKTVLTASRMSSGVARDMILNCLYALHLLV